MIKILRGTRVFVTGGTGFVGAHVVESLVQLGASVITTHLMKDPFSYFVLSGLEKKTTMVRLDVRDYEGVRHVLSRFNIEFVLHLAAQPLVEVALENPMHTLDTNIMGTVAILEAARMTKDIRGVVVASSDKAYGKHGKEKYRETDQLIGDHPYEVSKSASDLICTSYAKTYHLPVVVTRFGNIYGEGDLNLSRIVPGIMEAIVHHHELQIRSDGTYVRDYLYVKDVVQGYLKILEEIDHVRGETFNFGSKDTMNVIELISTVQKTLKKNIPYTLLDKAVNEIPYQSLDYTKIHKALGWSPKYSLKKTLPQILRWYKRVLK